MTGVFLRIPTPGRDLTEWRRCALRADNWPALNRTVRSMEEIQLYLWALGANAKWMLAGGPYFLEGIVKRLAPEQFKKLEERWPATKRKPFEIWIMAIGVLLAGFFAWKDEHALRVAAETQVTTLQTQLRQKKDRASIKEQLKNFFVTSNDIFFRQLPKDISNEDFQKFVADSNRWFNETAQWIYANLGPAAAAKFADIGGILPINWDRAANPTHNGIINSMTKYRSNLQNLIGNRHVGLGSLMCKATAP
jgi:hypothetical protein